MNITTLVIILLVALIAIFFVVKTVSANRNKKNYVPPKAKERIEIPEPERVKFPCDSIEEMKFCQKCGNELAGDAMYCNKCGEKL